MNFSKLDAYMEQMPERGLPACELSVSRDGKIVYRKCVGFADAAKTRPVKETDTYWLFSATKVITCIAAMRLVEQGVIALDDPVSKYIPEYARLRVLNKDGSICDAQNVMTVEHLFTMCGGLNYDISHEIIKKAVTETPSTLDIVKSFAQIPLDFEPGTRYKYSLCHDVLAAVIEVTTGMRFSEYLRTNILDPLGIVDMGFRPNDGQKERFSAQYIYKNGTGEVTEIPIFNKYQLSPDYDSGGAGLFGTVDEYMKIITAVACGGKTPDGYVILKPETIKMMGENRLRGNILNDLSRTRLYGYGWGLCGRAHFDPIRSMSLAPVGEFGWDGAAGAFSMIDPINHVALYFGTHVFGCDYAYHSIHPTLRNLAYEGINA